MTPSQTAHPTEGEPDQIDALKKALQACAYACSQVKKFAVRPHERLGQTYWVIPPSIIDMADQANKDALVALSPQPPAVVPPAEEGVRAGAVTWNDLSTLPREGDRVLTSSLGYVCVGTRERGEFFNVTGGRLVQVDHWSPIPRGATDSLGEKYSLHPSRPQGEEGLAQEPKYRFDGGRVINRASGEAIPLDEPVFVFRARDNFALRALDAYLCAFEHHHPDAREHAVAVRSRMVDFARFKGAHPERMKEPDTDLSNQGKPSS